MAQVNLPLSLRFRRASVAPVRRTPAEFPLFVVDFDELKSVAKVVSKAAIMCAVFGVCGLILAKPLYQLKCDLGMDIIPGVHAPNVFEGLE